MLLPNLGWTAGGVGGGAAMLGYLGRPKDSSASKTFWIYEVLPALWNFSAQFQLETVELSFFHQVLHTSCETFPVTSQMFPLFMDHNLEVTTVQVLISLELQFGIK